MNIPDSLFFEILGRSVVDREIQRRQIADLVKRLRDAEEALAENRSASSEPEDTSE